MSPPSETPACPSTSSAGPPPRAGEDQDSTETRLVAGWVLDQILVMLHPFMPFITEELWDKMGDRGGNLLIHAQWPEPAAEIDAEAKAEIDWAVKLIGDIRAARTELNVPPGARVPFSLQGANAQTQERLLRQKDAIIRLARIEPSEKPGGEVQIGLNEATFSLQLGEVIDLAAERARLTKSAEAVAKEVASLASRLANPAFVEKAKPEAVEKTKSDHAEKSAEVERLQAALARLG